jgi:hypothetical protein
MTEITRYWAHSLADSIIYINCMHCKEFSKPVNESCCWCEGISEVVNRELFFAGSDSEHRQDDENIVSEEWGKIQKKWFGESGLIK